MKPLGWALSASLVLHIGLLMFFPFVNITPPSLVGGRRAVTITLSAGPKTCNGAAGPASQTDLKPPLPETAPNHVFQKTAVTQPKTSPQLSPPPQKRVQSPTPSIPLKTATLKSSPKSKPVKEDRGKADLSPPTTNTIVESKPPVHPPPSPQSQPVGSLPAGTMVESVKKRDDIEPEAASALESQCEVAGQGGVSGKTVIKAVPLYRLNPPPSYPRLARRKGLEGRVSMDVLVSADGKVQDIKVAISSGYHILDRAALKTVQKWRFEPARSGGKAVAMWVEVPIRFRLRVQ